MRRSASILNFSVFNKMGRMNSPENFCIRQNVRRGPGTRGRWSGYFRPEGSKRNETGEFNEKGRKNVRIGWTIPVE